MKVKRYLELEQADLLGVMDIVGNLLTDNVDINLRNKILMDTKAQINAVAQKAFEKGMKEGMAKNYQVKSDV